MEVIIFGNTGFIGENLQRQLSKAYSVSGISLRDENWKQKISGCHPDVFINLVGKAHDHKGTATEQEYYHANVELAKQIFNAFRKSEAKILIHISSLAALAEFLSVKPLEESDIPNPASFYGKSKRAAEEWLTNQTLPDDKKLIIIRPPMVHGPGDKGNLGLLYKLITKGIPYPLSSFDNKRSFISIDNFCFFIEQIIKGQKYIMSGIYHISDDEALSTREIIQLIKEVNHKKVPDIALPKFIVKGIAKLGDVIPIPLNTKRLLKLTSSLMVSNSKIKSALKIKTLPFSARQGLEKTILSFKNS